jgi:hypothetical protein
MSVQYIDTDKPLISSRSLSVTPKATNRFLLYTKPASYIMSSESMTTSTSIPSVNSVISKTRAHIENSLPSSSRASSDAPTDLDSTSLRGSSAPAKAIHFVSSGGSSTFVAHSQSQSPNRSRRHTRSTPAKDVAYGPQHLEHEYSLAYEELRSATIYALYRLGYTNPKRRSPEDEVYIPSLAMVLAARFPDVERARRRINEADRKIREALEMGHTWHNTPWPNYRVIFDEQGMAVDVVEVEAGDEEETDEDENELREVWAKFETQVCKSAPVSKVCSDHIDRGTKHTGGRPKRKCREDADDTPLDNNQRRKLEPTSSLSSLSSSTTTRNTASKPCALRGPEHDPPLGRRPGLRSANTTNS